MPNFVDTTNDLDHLVSKTPLYELNTKSEHGEDLELGGRDWSSLIRHSRKQRYDRSLRFLSSQDDRIGELVGEGLAGRSIAVTINVSVDRVTVPQQAEKWIVTSSNLKLSDENFFAITAASYLDYQNTVAGWIGRQSAEPSKEDEVETPWDSDATPLSPFEGVYDVLVWSATADFHSGLKSNSTAWLGELLDKLREMRNLEPGWDSYEALPPNDWALKKAQEALWAFSSCNMQPDKVLPSVENGVGISVTRGERYGFLEVLNSREIVCVTACGNGTYKVEELSPADIAEGVERICAFASG